MIAAERDLLRAHMHHWASEFSAVKWELLQRQLLVGDYLSARVVAKMLCVASTLTWTPNWTTWLESHTQRVNRDADLAIAAIAKIAEVDKENKDSEKDRIETQDAYESLTSFTIANCLCLEP